MENKRIELVKTFATWGEYFAYKKSREWKAKGYNECGLSLVDKGNGNIIMAKFYKIV